MNCQERRLTFFFLFQEKLDKLTETEARYIQTYNTVTHSDKRGVSDYLHTAHVAVFLYQLLKQANYFQSLDNRKYEIMTVEPSQQINFTYKKIQKPKVSSLAEVSSIGS